MGLKAADAKKASADREATLASAKAAVETDLEANDAVLIAEEAKQRADDTARYEALAREHGADLSEEAFNEALRKMGRRGAGG